MCTVAIPDEHILARFPSHVMVSSDRTTLSQEMELWFTERLSPIPKLTGVWTITDGNLFWHYSADIPDDLAIEFVLRWM